MRVQKEIIFEIPEHTEYRVVCRYGYGLLPDVWYFHIEQKQYFKKYVFFGEVKFKWKELDYGWSGKYYKDRGQLFNMAMKFFDQYVLEPERRRKRTMEM